MNRSSEPIVSALVLAAGSGARFGSMKQFVELTDGVRLVDAAIATVTECADRVIVVLNPDAPGEERATTADRWPTALLVDGGADRLESVRLGLAALAATDADQTAQNESRPAELVIVHDAAHPLASPDLVTRLRSAIVDADGCVPILDAVDVIKRVDEHGNTETVGRKGLGAAQVPMVFSRSAIEQAHGLRNDGPLRRSRADGRIGPTAVEDSAAIEAFGGRVRAVPGEVTNVHVVDDESLELARLIASSRGSDKGH